jgi:hypothetical protein
MKVHTYVEGGTSWAASILMTLMQWCNRDLIPIPEDRRPWKWQGFAGYRIITGMYFRSDRKAVSSTG